MSKILFSGCSYTDGTGFESGKNESGLWVNLLHSNNRQFKNLDLVNSGLGGRSNAGIFQDTVWHISRNDFKFAIVSWTDMPRYELELGLENYNTRQFFIPNGPTRTHNLNDVVYDQQYLDKIRDRFVSLAHLHHEIKTLIYYVNALIEVSKKFKTKLFFINALCPWDNNYFKRLADISPTDTTEFTRHQLNLDNRDDKEFFSLYKKIHDEYDEAGGIQESHWLNLYNSLRSNQIDVNQDGSHPGLESNKIYYKFLDQALQQIL
jgi:hypothetical protein